MLIDAAHPEETRVAIINNGRLTAFEFDAKANAQLSGNIYLARVVHVEPALQAAFVDYGGERDGFLALPDIHPDYYQIPDHDRQVLLREDRKAADAERESEDHDTPPSETGNETESANEPDPDAEEEEEKINRPPPPRAKNYAIQEVIKRRQVLLVQIYREPRGNKGAALTTYLSLAGRYCVLAPNTARGGGISRKIDTSKNRTRLKSIVQELDVAPEHGVIIRTAGSERTKAEIKRDYAALLKQWEEIRTTTLESYAPCLIHEESSLIRRAIRDLYDKDMDAIQIDGDDAYRDAKQYMRLLMPSHAKNIKQYNEKTQIFVRHKVDHQLDALFDPEVRLPSGGWIVLEPVEAMTCIDVNSGRSTKERNIENTALHTNLEAAEEVARQLQLRDISGLIVIDFIDMDVGRNRRAVESRLKECLKSDRARGQIGQISGFGLLEMSRQRLKKGMLEMSTEPCPHCAGSGRMRTDASFGLSALRQAEEQAATHSGSRAKLRVSVGVANFLSNTKRMTLNVIEERHGVQIEIAADPSMQAGKVDLSWGGQMDRAEPPTRTEPQDSRERPERSRTEESPDDEEEETREGEARDSAGDADRSGRRRRSRRGGRGRRRPSEGEDDVSPAPPLESAPLEGERGRRRPLRNEEEDDFPPAHPRDSASLSESAPREGGRGRRRPLRNEEEDDFPPAHPRDSAPLSESAPREGGRGRRRPLRNEEEDDFPPAHPRDSASLSESTPREGGRGRRRPLRNEEEDDFPPAHPRDSAPLSESAPREGGRGRRRPLRNEEEDDFPPAHPRDSASLSESAPREGGRGRRRPLRNEEEDDFPPAHPRDSAPLSESAPREGGRGRRRPLRNEEEDDFPPAHPRDSAPPSESAPREGGRGRRRPLRNKEEDDFPPAHPRGSAPPSESAPRAGGRGRRRPLRTAKKDGFSPARPWESDSLDDGNPAFPVGAKPLPGDPQP